MKQEFRSESSEEEGRMLTLPVPDYFQEDNEDALRSRMQWLEAEVGFGDPFFAGLLKMDEGTFAGWKEQRTDLPRAELLALRELWDMLMHVLSFVNFDSGRARRLLEHVPPAASRPAGASEALPWAGSSIKTYLETHGPGAVEDVNRWVTSFRFGAPSLTPEPEVPCPSSLD
jgi:hypothetical protein